MPSVLIANEELRRRLHDRRCGGDPDWLTADGTPDPNAWKNSLADAARGHLSAELPWAVVTLRAGEKPRLHGLYRTRRGAQMVATRLKADPFLNAYTVTTTTDGRLAVYSGPEHVVHTTAS